MGQAQSEVATGVEEVSPSTTTHTSSSTTTAAGETPSMDSLLAEAAAYGDAEGETLDAKAQKALECPCIAGLRSGACGTQFSEAFLCFMKSTSEEKGSDCVQPFVALQNCIKANPNAFSSKDMDLEDDEEEEEEEVKKEEEEAKKEYRIIPPKWSRGETPPTSKL